MNIPRESLNMALRAVIAKAMLPSQRGKTIGFAATYCQAALGIGASYELEVQLLYVLSNLRGMKPERDLIKEYHAQLRGEA